MPPRLTISSLAALAAIVLIAGFFRLWQLDAVPPGLYPDEAVNANTAVRALDTKNFDVFYLENHGREGLYMNLIAIAFGLFGIHIFSLKIVSAISGIATVWGVYLLSKELFARLNYPARKILLASLFASFLLSLSFWHINFSRIGFRGILVPLVLTFSSYFLFRGFRTKSLWDFIFAGLVFGVGFHTYISFRTAPLAFGYAIVLWLFMQLRERNTIQALQRVSLFLLFSFIVALPIGLYFLGHPEDFVSRATGVSIFRQEEPLKAFVISLAKHLGMFHIYGDPNWRHNFSGKPQLSLSSGIFFLIALIGAKKEAFSRLSRLRKEGMRMVQKEQGDFFLVWGFLAMWFFALLLPGVLTFEGIPHALRTIGVIPVAYILAGLGGYNFFEWIGTFSRRRLSPIFLYALIVFFIAGSIISAWRAYFITWAAHPKVKEAFTRRFVDVGDYLNGLPEAARAYVIMSEGDLPAEVPKFMQRAAARSNALYVQRNDLIRIMPKPGDIVVTMNKERNELDMFIQRFPNGELMEFERFWVYRLNYSH